MDLGAPIPACLELLHDASWPGGATVGHLYRLVDASVLGRNCRRGLRIGECGRRVPGLSACFHDPTEARWRIPNSTETAEHDVDPRQPHGMPGTSPSSSPSVQQGDFECEGGARAAKSGEELLAPLPPGPVMGGMPRIAIPGGITDHTAHHRGAPTVSYSPTTGEIERPNR
jgi:hypothetical protein